MNKTITSLIILSASFIQFAFSANNAPSNQAIQAIADQFYPQALLDEASQNQIKAKLELGIEADLDHTGKPDYIVAAYSNTLTNVVRILRKTSSGATLVAESNLPCMMGGLRPTIKLVDLDNDQKPEIRVNFGTNRGATADWYFKWTGSSLKYFGPTISSKNGWTCTAVTTSSVVDLNGTGQMAILDGPDHLAPDASDLSGQPEIAQAYVLSNGSYVPGPKVYLDWYLVRKQGAPVARNKQFFSDASGGTYILHILNGDTNGGKRVSSADVTINGKTVAGPSNFGKNVRVIDIAVTLQSTNTITVTLRSEPGSSVRVMIERVK